MIYHKYLCSSILILLVTLIEFTLKGIELNYTLRLCIFIKLGNFLAQSTLVTLQSTQARDVERAGGGATPGSTLKLRDPDVLSSATFNSGVMANI